jgi:hypothetical protein
MPLRADEDPDTPLKTAHSDENGHPFRRKAATHSNPKRPLFQRSGMAGVIVAVG